MNFKLLITCFEKRTTVYKRQFVLTFRLQAFCRKHSISYTLKPVSSRFLNREIYAIYSKSDIYEGICFVSYYWDRNMHPIIRYNRVRYILNKLYSKLLSIYDADTTELVFGIVESNETLNNHLVYVLDTEAV